jgi:hypothetical protein
VQQLCACACGNTRGDDVQLLPHAQASLQQLSGRRVQRQGEGEFGQACGNEGRRCRGDGVEKH